MPHVDSHPRLPHLLPLLIALLAGGAGVGLSAAPRSVSAQTPPPQVQLPGHTLPVLPRAAQAATAATAGSQAITLTIVLNRSDESGFVRLLQQIETPGSAEYQHFVSQADLTARFGPSQAAYDRVLKFLQQQGFTLVAGSANRLTLTVRGTRSQAERAFNVRLRDFAFNGRSFYANDADPFVPSDIAGDVRAVVGLNNLAVPQHTPAAVPAAGSAPSPANSVSIATAYDAAGLGSGITGAGQR